MKILSVCFCNLNSIKGRSPLIDFEKGELGEAGIFAITGPTGAGKTTILDAICVALYGETPRLRNPADLMTRHTGECWSEVEFEAGGCRYRSRWSLHRSRKKADGNLQSPKGELVLIGVAAGYESGAGTGHVLIYEDGHTPDSGWMTSQRTIIPDEGIILEDKRGNIPKKIEEISGLDFKRFCRSVLLAQGDFDAFLNANINERADLLEKMTGTEIYGEISKLAFQRFKQENEKLQILKGSLEGITLMSAEEIERHHAELELPLIESEKIASQIEKIVECRNWYRAIESLEISLEKASEELSANRSAFEAASDDLLRLKIHEEAAVFQPRLDLIDQCRDDIKNDIAEQSLIEEALKKSAENLEEREIYLSDIRSGWEEFIRSRDAVEKIIPEVIRLDEQISITGRQISELAIRKTALEKRAEDIKAEIIKKEAGRSKTVELKRNAEEYLEKNREDQILESKFYWLNEKLKNLSIQRAASDRGDREIISKKKELQVLFRSLENKEKEKRDAETHLEKSKEDKDKLSAELNRMLSESGSLEQLDEQIGRCSTKITIYEKLVDISDHLKSASKSLDEALNQKIAIEKETSAVSIDADNQRKKVDELELDLEDLRKKRELELLISKYEEDRKALQAGAPCPLCGSTSHPFTDHSPHIHTEETSSDNTSRRMEEKREKIRFRRLKLSEAEASLSAQRQKTVSLIEKIDESGKRLRDDIERWLKVLDKISDRSNLPEGCLETLKECGETDIDSNISLLISLFISCSEKMSALLPGLEKEKERLSIESGRIRQAGNDLLMAEKNFAANEKRYESAAQFIKEITLRIESASRESEELSKRVEEIKDGIRSDESEILKPFSTLGIDIPEHGKEDLCLKTLERRLNLFREHSDSRSSAERELISIKSEIDELVHKESTEDIALTEVKSACTSREKEIESLRELRNELFGEKKPEQEKLKIASEEKKISDNLERARKGVEESREAKAGSETRLSVNLENQKRHREKLERVRCDLAAEIEHLPFNTEEKLRSSILDRDTFLKIKTLKKGLELKKVEIEAKAVETKKRLEQEKGKNLSDAISQIIDSSDLFLLHNHESINNSDQVKIPDPDNITETVSNPDPVNNPDPVDALERAIDDLSKKRSEKERQIGAGGAVLKAQEDLKIRQSEKLLEIEAQSKEWSRWNTMNELIGSADGMKFRRFAQGITLENLVKIANRHMERLNSRYILQRNRENDLEIEIIDTYQADAVRPARTLSGGESFLVSLALALGLSSLSSRNIRVDSLFLDEGFGTLDPDMLDVALAALHNLQSSGKTIGIISHVEALKERIPARINVIRKSGGISEIAMDNQ